MNKLALVFSALLLGACAQQPVVIGVEDAEDFFEWQAGQDDDDIEPFKPVPIFVTGVGEMRAAPDIAVITGRIKTEAKADYIAMDEAAQITNIIQDQIAGKNISISFTGLSTTEERDAECLRHNQIANARHWDIVRDNNFNAQQMRQRADVRQKLRPAKRRIAQKVCPVTHVESTVGFTAWVKPAGDVQRYLQSFTAAGADNVTLFGYDFSNYDALYNQAAEKAVTNARDKAQMSASGAGTTLGAIEFFFVSSTTRTQRFGQQAMIISPHGDRFVPQNQTTFADRVVRSQSSGRPAPAPADARLDRFAGGGDDEVVVTGSRLRKESYSSYTPIAVVSVENASSEGLFSEQDALYATNQYSGTGMEVSAPSSNALRQSMMSGAKVIRVEALISFSYDTPINGVIFKTEEE